MTQDIQFMEACGKRLEYTWVGADAGARHDGDPSAPVLVFLHEGLGCIDMWRDVPATVAELVNMPGLVYSRAGFGRSDPVGLPRPANFHDHEAYDVLPRVLDAAGIETAVLFGHSDGGTIALMTASRDGRVKGVISIAAHVFNETITRTGAKVARLSWQTTDLREKLRRYHGDKVDDAFFGWNDTWLRDDFRDWNVEPCLAAVTCPVLVAQGERDQYGSKRQVEAIAGQVSGPAEILMIPKCGHAPHQDAPHILFPRVNEFVARLAL